MKIGDKLLNRYIIKEELGRGAFGVVYLAHDSVTNISVAIKTIPEEVAREESEIDDIRVNFKLINKLSHQHIASVRHLERDESTGRYFLIMEYVKGDSLKDHRKSYPGRKIPFEKAVEIISQIAEALDYAHKHSRIHRDIKPENIKIDSRGEVKVLDFGLAAEIRSSMGRMSKMVFDTSGTRPYMSPEQMMGKYQDAASDNYSLGVVFYEMVSGRVPFESGADFQVMANAVCTVKPEALKELSKQQNEVLLKMLAKKKEDRYKTGLEFVDALKKTVAAKKMPVAAVIAISVVSVLAIVAAIFAYNRYQDQHRKYESMVVEQLFSKVSSYGKDKIEFVGIVPEFKDCSSNVYNNYSAAITNIKGISILDKKAFGEIIKDQDITNLYKEDIKDEVPLGIKNMPHTHAILLGECDMEESKIHMRLIGVNGVRLGEVNEPISEVAGTIATKIPPVETENVAKAPTETIAAKDKALEAGKVKAQEDAQEIKRKAEEDAQAEKRSQAEKAAAKKEASRSSSSGGSLGIITYNGLQWYVGPDEDTNWDQASAWVKSLSVGGGGWRMPTRAELKGLYHKGMGDRNMPPEFKTTGWRVWSNEQQGSSAAWYFGFDFFGYENTATRSHSADVRAFAVRSR